MGRFISHPRSIIETTQIGSGTRIGAFTHILPDVVIGNDCNIGDHVFIGNDVVTGNRVIIQNGVQILSGVEIEDDVNVGPNTVIVGAPFLPNQNFSGPIPHVLIKKSVSIGANAMLRHGTIISQYSVIEAGTIVNRDVPPYAIVAGNPAQITGYVSTLYAKSEQARMLAPQKDILSVVQVKRIKLPRIVDIRGSLTFGEYDKHLPFIPKRYFVIFDVPSAEVRGEHAHKEALQFLICLKGSCAVVVDDGTNREEINLCEPDVGIYLPPMIWGIQYKFSPDAVLLVLTSDIYDANDYIRDYTQYLDLLKSK